MDNFKIIQEANEDGNYTNLCWMGLTHAKLRMMKQMIKREDFLSVVHPHGLIIGSEEGPELADFYVTLYSKSNILKDQLDTIIHFVNSQNT